MTLTADLGLDLIVREDAQDGYITTLYGRAIPYGQTATINGASFGIPGRISESFEREAFNPKDVIGKPLAWRHDEPIGVITAAHNEPDGLYVTAGILDTAAGRDADTLLRSGAVKGLSPGFLSPKALIDKAKRAVKHVTAELIELSLTHQPAYAAAGVSAFREETAMTDTITVPETADVPVEDIQAREALASVQNDLADLRASIHAAGGDPVHPLAQYRNTKEYLVAAIHGDVETRTLNVSALSEQTGMIPPTWLKDVKGVLDRGRPCINALGGPMSAGSAGIDVKWPIFGGDLSAIVATVAADGTEANSADIDITVGTASLALYASANRLTYQVIERADPSYVDAWYRIMVGAFGTETDYAFQTAMFANDTIATGVDYDFSADTTGANFLAAVWTAMIDCQRATGQPADAVFVSSAVYKKIGDPAWTSFQSANYPVQNVAGTFNGQTLGVNIFGVPVVPAYNFATDESQDAVVTNRAALGWVEDGPRFASADQPGNVSRDIAIYGYAVATPFIPAGIVSIYNAA